MQSFGTLGQVYRAGGEGDEDVQAHVEQVYGDDPDMNDDTQAIVGWEVVYNTSS